MKKLLFILFSIANMCHTVAQTNLDSLYSVWQNERRSDSVRVDAYADFVLTGYMFNNPDTAFELSKAFLTYGAKRDYPQALAYGHHYQGISWYLRAEYAKALICNEKALKIRNRIGDEKGASKSLGNMGLIFQVRGAYSKALDYYMRSLKIKEAHNDQKGMASSYNNIGTVYKALDEYEKASEFYRKSLEISEVIGDNRTTSNCLINLGGVLNEQGQPSEGLKFLNRALALAEESDNQNAVTAILGNLGQSYELIGDTAMALDYHSKSLEVAKQIGNQSGIVIALLNLGIIEGKLENYESSIKFCSEAFELAKTIGALENQMYSCDCLYYAYKSLGNSNGALIYHELLNSIEDTLNAEDARKQLQQIEFEKQVLADSLANVEEARLVEEAHNEEVRKKNKTRNALIGGGLLLLLVSISIYGRLRYTRKAKAAIEKEKDRSENLLLNILPADIAAELKEKGRADARDFEKVSILFTDFKGFTAASEKLSAQDLVSEINTCFEAFDGIMGKYGIEKIKTIGDAYMAAGGLPVPTDDSVKNTVLAALEMQAFISERKAKLDAEGKPGFEMRVGVHTGPVVAGIVGVKKFQYDIWGDTVNTASRMESSGEVSKVNISQSTYELLKNDTSTSLSTGSQFAFESRGKIEAKGKGEMEMYFVSQKT